jgi:arylsulfatase A-like enzyme
MIATGPLGDETWFTSRGEGRPSQRPDLVFIFADDLGWADLGCFGSTEISTPNLDRLAGEGVRFTHAYSASPVCSPTRIGLYTGRYPGRLRAGLEEPMRTRGELNGIPHSHPTLPKLLAGAGYTTAMFGKWHCGWLPWFSPLRAGFQRFYGCLDGAIDYFQHIDTLGAHDLWEGETEIEDTGYFTELISREASAHIATAAPEPLYVQLNYTAPHWPWEGPGDAHVGARIRAEYAVQDTPDSYPLCDFHDGSIAKYAEMVEAMDTGIGQVLDAIEARGRSGDTLVVFSSDNGGERWAKMWPFVGEKGDLTEGGIRVPFLIRWPAAIDGDQVCDRPSITMDWTATMLDAAGTDPDPDHPLDGVSLLPYLVDGAPHPERDLCWRTTSQVAVRRGDMKYLDDRRLRPEKLGQWPLRAGDHHLLYDVTVDGRERADLAPHHPGLTAELRAVAERFEAEMLPYPAEAPGRARNGTDLERAVGHPD